MPRSCSEECPSVRRVWTRSQLTAGGGGGDPFFGLFFNGFHPERSPDLTIQWREGLTRTRGTATTHKSPYDYDRVVPMLFWSPRLAASRSDELVRTVDFAPTLAGLLDLPMDESVEGRDLLASPR